MLDCKTPMGYFSFIMSPIHYNIFAEGRITGRNLNPNRMSLMDMANWRDECDDEAWQR
jgi:hypothetical protein